MTHRYHPVEIEPVYRSLMCLSCGARGRSLGDDHACDGCGKALAAGDTNTSNAIEGWFHGTCLAERVTFRQEVDAIDVELSDVGRMASASSALAIRREQGDMD